MALILLGGAGGSGDAATAALAADAQAKATKAEADAANVRQMINNTNGRVASLAQVAALFPSTTAAADQIHQMLQDEITVLQNDFQIDLTLLAEAAMQ